MGGNDFIEDYDITNKTSTQFMSFPSSSQQSCGTVDKEFWIPTEHPRVLPKSSKKSVKSQREIHRTLESHEHFETNQESKMLPNVAYQEVNPSDLTSLGSFSSQPTSPVIFQENRVDVCEDVYHDVNDDVAHEIIDFDQDLPPLPSFVNEMDGWKEDNDLYHHIGDDVNFCKNDTEEVYDLIGDKLHVIDDVSKHGESEI